MAMLTKILNPPLTPLIVNTTNVMTSTTQCLSITAKLLPFISIYNKHFDELNTLLSLLQHNFSFIGISETRFLNGREPVFDFPIPGYSHISTPTDSSAGGLTLYVSNTLAFKPRPDLSSSLYSSKLLESVFVEIVNPNKPNLLVDDIYRHPCMSLKSFNSDFLKPFLHKEFGEQRADLTWRF